MSRMTRPSSGMALRAGGKLTEMTASAAGAFEGAPTAGGGATATAASQATASQCAAGSVDD